jgi:hypothetical protein
LGGGLRVRGLRESRFDQELCSRAALSLSLSLGLAPEGIKSASLGRWAAACAFAACAKAGSTRNCAAAPRSRSASRTVSLTATPVMARGGEDEDGKAVARGRGGSCSRGVARKVVSRNADRRSFPP